MTMTMTNDNFDDYPLIDGDDALDNFLGRIRNKEGRIVKYTRVEFNKRSSKRVIDDAEFLIDRMKAKVKACKNRLEKNQLYARIDGRQRLMKYAATYLN